jgi:hypothetical protein
MDSHRNAGTEADLGGRRRLAGVFKVGEHVERTGRCVRVHPCDQRRQVGADSDPEGVSLGLEVFAHRGGELDVVVEELDRGVGLEVLAEPRAVDHDPVIATEHRGLGIDRSGIAEEINRAVGDGRAPVYRFDPTPWWGVFDKDQDVASRGLPRLKASGQEVAGQGVEEVDPDPLP